MSGATPGPDAASPGESVEIGQLTPAPAVAAGGSATAPHVLAIDLGTSGMKLALVGYDGRLAAWAQRPVALHLLPGGGAEQDPAEWWAALGECADELARTHPTELASVTTVCASTQGEGTIAVDAAGEALTRCILWMDMRGEPHLRRQHRGPLRVNGVAAQRVAQWLRYTGGMPSTTGKDPAAHMLLVRDTMPTVYERTAVFLNVLDWFTLRLTGERVATVDSILTSWVTDNRDPANIVYQPGLVAASGIDADKLPPIVRCTDVVGTLTADAAEHLHLPTSVRVVAGAIDNTAAAIGAGTTQDYATHLYLGTSSWMAAHVPAKKTDVVAGIASVPCAVPDRYLLTALQATAGGNLAFVKDRVLGSTGDFAALEAEVQQSPPGANGVVYLPWIYGERAPVDDLTLRAGLLNVSLDTTRADLVRAVYEGVVLNTRWLQQPVERFMRRPIGALTVVGGGAQSDAWCQMFADALDVVVRRPSDPVAVNARGAAWIGAVGGGELEFSDIPALVEVDREFTPRADATAVYDARFVTFRDLHKRLAPAYKRLARAGR